VPLPSPQGTSPGPHLTPSPLITGLGPPSRYPVSRDSLTHASAYVQIQINQSCILHARKYRARSSPTRTHRVTSLKRIPTSSHLSLVLHTRMLMRICIPRLTFVFVSHVHPRLSRRTSRPSRRTTLARHTSLARHAWTQALHTRSATPSLGQCQAELATLLRFRGL